MTLSELRRQIEQTERQISVLGLGPDPEVRVLVNEDFEPEDFESGTLIDISHVGMFQRMLLIVIGQDPLIVIGEESNEGT